MTRGRNFDKIVTASREYCTGRSMIRYSLNIVVVASLCRGAQRAATRTATQRRGYNARVMRGQLGIDGASATLNTYMSPPHPAPLRNLSLEAYFLLSALLL